MKNLLIYIEDSNEILTYNQELHETLKDYNISKNYDENLNYHFIAKKINKKRVFEGGTCNGSLWRNELNKIIKIDYFNPVVDDWNEESQKREVYERENCDFCLYTITPLMSGVYSIAEIVEDSIKRPEKTLLCLLYKDDNKIFDEHQWKSLQQVSKMIEKYGVQTFYSLKEVADYLNK